jgi:translocation and assembly module TamA
MRMGESMLRILPMTAGQEAHSSVGIFSRSRQHWKPMGLWLAYALLLGLCLSLPRLVFAEDGVSYVPTIEGVADEEILTSMKDISDTFALQEKPPASVALLRLRAERDRDLFVQLLRARGHYAARVEVEVDSTIQPVKIAFRVDPGLPYVLDSVDIRLVEGTRGKPSPMPTPEEVGLVHGGPFQTKTLLDAEKEIVHQLGKRGSPFAKIAERKVVVDHRTQTVTLTIWIDPGVEVVFGPSFITGLESVDEKFLRRNIPWQEGEIFNVDLLEDLQKRLVSLGLFSLVRVTRGDTADDESRLAVHISLTERKHRSVGAGVSYKTDEGPGANISWEHRNLFHKGERLKISTTYSNYTFSGEGGFLKPYFWRDDQSLRLTARLARDNPPAYTSDNLQGAAYIDRSFTRQLKVSGGLGFKVSDVEQFGEKQSYTYLLFPFQIENDTSDDLLDPTRGGRLGFYLTYFQNTVQNENPDFLKAYGRYTRYFQLLKKPSLLFAGGISLGSLVGAESHIVPADERFYAGGGGSVRGYSYQSVGPLVGSDPVGGSSLLQASFEVRWKVTDRIGLVTFLDGGNVYAKKLPDLSEDLMWGAGAGFRYYTPVGPFRFDFALPLNKREGIDGSYQIYVSLGQAF